jgi:hypothetical protein
VHLTSACARCIKVCNALALIREFLGHLSEQITPDFYAGIDDEVHRLAARRLGSYLAPAVGNALLLVTG